jgi:hypothetical protein
MSETRCKTGLRASATRYGSASARLTTIAIALYLIAHASGAPSALLERFERLFGFFNLALKGEDTRLQLQMRRLHRIHVIMLALRRW